MLFLVQTFVLFRRCFKVYIDNEFWYAHSVEELVIWTVEKEKGDLYRSSIYCVHVE